MVVQPFAEQPESEIQERLTLYSNTYDSTLLTS